ncbi:hypothetical protein GCM10011609_13160 [Lentzea pudingi]|uniref:Uncharacterized protein n=1 Tax=Lentzea pudingi TaxID=1789439 RepID=A0ABQ2HG62_9PSEU|nr:hypothetical protein [Lentzea pudingi]GGM78784.1 hypothetical protein GCM10011609_13160 [Lentzea pudingi]
MARAEDVVPVVVNLTRAQVAVLARAAVVVTSALDCEEANAAMQGLLVFRQAVAGRAEIGRWACR